MLTAGALAIYAADVAFGVQPPKRPKRPARKPRQGAGILGAMRRLRREIATGLDESPWFPQVTRRYPY